MPTLNLRKEESDELKNKLKLIDLEKVNTKMLSSVQISYKYKKQLSKKIFPKFQSILMQVAKSGVVNKKTAAEKFQEFQKK